ncbi:SDR family oxidoreductase [Mucilaginibacter robiniae]|uniref:SDR family oxidoreductase n=1 Tax=Mucilaginibacter robiniae TaxID=2728022 RepID=A0A7L5E0S7_9SPHI|nr:SDR family oxidoreductase [Mucilaginibacter robiniae]QJD95889.1 SDR family oxidoreductase [Mucilaginibacter robiniae]
MKKVILITGASSGLGLAAARALAAQGHRVYGTARHPEQMQENAFNLILMDVTDDASVQHAVNLIIKAEGRIDVLVNNAGLAFAGPLYTMPVAYAQQQFEVNFFGVVRVSSAVLPSMIQQKSGLVINISSIAGLLGVPYHGLYSASKFAVEGYSESLRMELKNTGVKVVVVNPGDFKTSATINRQHVASTLNHQQLNAESEAAIARMAADEAKGSHPDLLAALICKIVKQSHPAQRYLVGAIGQTIVPTLKKILPAAVFTKLLSAYYGIK